jgi:hypothetical protein
LTAHLLTLVQHFILLFCFAGLPTVTEQALLSSIGKTFVSLFSDQQHNQ